MEKRKAKFLPLPYIENKVPGWQHCVQLENTFRGSGAISTSTGVIGANDATSMANINASVSLINTSNYSQ